MRFHILLPVVLGFLVSLVSVGGISAGEIPQEMPREMPQDSPDPVTENSRQEPLESPEPPSPEKGTPKVGSPRVVDFFSWLFSDEDEDEDGVDTSPSFFGSAGSLRSFDLIGWLLGEDDEDTGITTEDESPSREDAVAVLSDDENIQEPPPPVTPPEYEILFAPLRSPLMAEGREERFDLYLWFLTELPARRINAQLRKLTEKQQR